MSYLNKLSVTTLFFILISIIFSCKKSKTEIEKEHNKYELMLGKWTVSGIESGNQVTKAINILQADSSTYLATFEDGHLVIIPTSMDNSTITLSSKADGYWSQGDGLLTLKFNFINNTLRYEYIAYELDQVTKRFVGHIADLYSTDHIKAVSLSASKETADMAGIRQWHGAAYSYEYNPASGKWDEIINEQKNIPIQIFAASESLIVTNRLDYAGVYGYTSYNVYNLLKKNSDSIIFLDQRYNIQVTYYFADKSFFLNDSSGYNTDNYLKLYTP